jgi:hypothetical protein
MTVRARSKKVLEPLRRRPSRLPSHVSGGDANSNLPLFRLRAGFLGWRRQFSFSYIRASGGMS